MGTTRYVWNKYSTGTDYKISIGDKAYTAGYTIYSLRGTSSVTYYFAKSVTYDGSSFVGSDVVSFKSTKETELDQDEYPYYLGRQGSTSSTCYYATGGIWYNYYAEANDVYYYTLISTRTVYEVEATEVTVQGSTSYGYVSSSSSSTYGTSTSGTAVGSYWYVYKGSDTVRLSSVTLSPTTPVSGESLTITATAASTTYGGTFTYEYYYGLNTDDPDDATELISQTTGTAVTMTVPDDTESITVKVMIVADGYGWSNSSSYVSTTADVYTYTAPTAPDEITAAGGTYEGLIFTDDTITVTWSASTDADDDLTGYIVQRSYNGGSYTTVYQGSALTCTDTAASTWTTVQYRVQAYDNQGLYSDYTYSDTYAVTANTAPSAPAAVTIPTSIYLDVQHTISWSASTDSEGDTVYYEAAVSYDGGTTWETVTSGITTTSTTATITDASITQVQYRVRAYDTYGACSSWTYSSTRTVINNTSPTITVTADGAEISSGGDIGTYTDTAPDVSVAIYDADGDTVTVTVTMGSTTLSSEEISGSGTVAVDFGDWQTVTNGTYTLTVTADDGTDTVTWTGSMTKDMSSCTITMTENVTTENTITGVVMSISGSIPDDATVSCLATADGSTWEDVTDYASEASLYAFTTTGKSFNFKLSIERGETTGYVSSVQGVLITEE